ncbi:MAG: TIGR03435 family protein [Verrucomicrobiota bacterium]
MPQSDDITLLKQYAECRSETAFAALVERYVHLVYSTALRQVGNPSHAEEIAQAVFIILTRKAKSLGPGTILSGWLYQTARLTAANFLRSEIRRQQREQEAYMESLLNDPAPNVWRQIAPLLDDAMGCLSESDRNVVVLRFFQNKSAAEIGDALGLDASTAQKRITRAVGRLRKFFAGRGMAHSAELIAGAISSNSVQAAPVGLAATISAAAVKSSAVAASTLTLVKGALKLMAWTKAKTAVVAGLTVLIAAGTTTIIVNEIQEHKTYPWQVKEYDPRVLDQAPPQVRILPAKHPLIGGGWGMGTGRDKIMGLGQPAKNVIQAAYAKTYGTKHLTRIVPLVELPPGRFDFISSLPEGNAEALQREVKRKFGVVARLDTRETDVLLLKVNFPNAAGLKPVANLGRGSIIRQGKLNSRGAEIGFLRMELEDYFQIPVLDRTGLTGNFDMDATWNEPVNGQNRDALKQALIDQLGLELVPGRAPIEMLVVEKAN